MPKFNDLDLENWKEIDLNMDSLWVIPERKKGQGELQSKRGSSEGMKAL